MPLVKTPNYCYRHSTLLDTSIDFSRVAGGVYIFNINIQEFQFITILVNTCYPHYSLLILPIVNLIYISLMTHEVEHLMMFIGNMDICFLKQLSRLLITVLWSHHPFSCNFKEFFIQVLSSLRLVLVILGEIWHQKLRQQRQN